MSRSVPARLGTEEQHVAWETGLQIGDTVEARWTRRYGLFRWKARARIVKFNLCSAQVVLEENALPGANQSKRYDALFPSGRNLTVPLCYYNGPLRYSGGLEIYKQGARIRPSKWSEYNCLVPLE